MLWVAERLWLALYLLITIAIRPFDRARKAGVVSSHSPPRLFVYAGRANEGETEELLSQAGRLASQPVLERLTLHDEEGKALHQTP